MKKLTLLISGFLIFAFAHAQNNFPSPSDNPFWLEQHEQLWACSTNGTYGYCYGYYCECTKPVYYGTDVVINDTVYNRLYSRGVCHAYQVGQWNPDCPYSFDYLEAEYLIATIRNDTANNMVYVNNGNWEELLYDFNLTVGQVYPETANNYSNDTLVVTSEELILLGDKYARKWELGIRDDGIVTNEGFVSIIEGIGSTFGLFAELIPPFENQDELLCFGMNDEVHYPDASYECDITVDVREISEEKSLTIYPNPTSSRLTIETKENFQGKAEIRILNISGQEVLKNQVSDRIFQINTSSLESGVYFIQFRNEQSTETVRFIKE